jgi:hypothetical protein
MKTQSKNNCYSNCDKNAKPVCARSAAFAAKKTREKRVEAGSRSFQTSGGRVCFIPAGFLFHNGSTNSDSLFPSSFWMDARAGYPKFLARRFSQDPVLIDLRTVRYPQPVLVNNLYPPKKPELHF